MIFNKTLKFFRENPENPEQNINILSIICKNMKYLDENYSDFLSKYCNEMILFMNDSDSDIIHEDVQHLYSFCDELSITKVNFLYLLIKKMHGLFHLFWKLFISLFISIILLILLLKVAQKNF